MGLFFQGIIILILTVGFPATAWSMQGNAMGALRRILQDIGGVVGTFKPSCFIVRCETDENVLILEKQKDIRDCLELMGIRTTLATEGDVGGLGYGRDIHTFMKQGVLNSDFVLCCFTQKFGVRFDEAGRRGLDSGIRHEVIHITDRIEQTLKNGQPLDFFIPILMEGDKFLSVPTPLRPYLYVDVGARNPQDFCVPSFFGEMRSLFETRFFKQHPNLKDIQKLMAEMSRAVPQAPVVTTVVRTRTFAKDPERYNCSGIFFPKSLGTQDKVFVNRSQENGEPYLRSIFYNLFRQGEPEAAITCVALCALDGMGGVGKTTLAVEYAWAYGRHYDAVFWMDASSENSLKRSYVSLLNKLSGKQEVGDAADRKSKEELATEVIQKLEKSSYEKWLLICDNAEHDKDVDDLLYLPRGHVLCTSRYTDWRNKIDVGLLSEEEAIELLYKVSQISPNEEGRIYAKQLVCDRLGGLALAITQAGSYIRQSRVKGKGISVKEYIELFDDVAKRPTLLSYSVDRTLRHPSNDQRNQAVATTWQITMEKVSEEARQLMSCFAYLSPDNILVRLFYGDKQKEVEAALDELVLYSMISRSHDYVSVHRLLQFVEQSQRRGNATPATLVKLGESWSLFLVRELEKTRWQSFSRMDLIDLYNVSFSILQNAEKIKKHVKSLAGDSMIEGHRVNLEVWFRCLEVRACYFVSKISNDLILGSRNQWVQGERTGEHSWPRYVCEKYMPGKVGVNPFSFKRIMRLVEVRAPRLIRYEMDAHGLLSAVAHLDEAIRESAISFAKEVVSPDAYRHEAASILKCLGKVKKEEWQSCYQQARLLAQRYELSPSNVFTSLAGLASYDEREDVIARLGDLLKGVTRLDEYDFSRLVQIFGGLSGDERRKLLAKVKRLTVDTMSGKDIVTVTQAVANVNPDNWKSTESLAEPLYVSTMTAVERARINAAVKEIHPSDRLRVVAQSRSFITERMGTDDRIEILRGISRAKAEEWWDELALKAKVLMGDNISASKQMSILKALAGVSLNDMDNVVARVQMFKRHNIRPDTVESFIRCFSGIGVEHRERVARYLASIWVSDMSYYDVYPLVEVVKAIREGEEQNVLELASQLFLGAMRGSEKAKVIHFVNTLDVSERDFIVSQTVLFKSILSNVQDIERLVQKIRDLKGDQAIKASLLESVRLFCVGLTKIEEWFSVLEKLASLTLAERSNVISVGLKFITRNTKLADRLDVINGLKQVKQEVVSNVQEGLGDVFHRLNQSSLLNLLNILNPLQESIRTHLLLKFKMLEPHFHEKDLFKVMDILTSLTVEESEKIHTLIKDLLGVDFDNKEYLAALKLIATLSFEDRDSIARCIHQLMWPGMTWGSKMDMARALRNIPSVTERDEVVSAVVESALPASAGAIRILATLDSSRRKLAIAYTRQFVPESMNDTGRNVVEIIMHFCKTFDERNLNVLQSLLHKMGGKEQVSFLRKMQKVDLEKRESVFLQMVSQWGEVMSEEDMKRLIHSVTRFEKPCETTKAAVIAVPSQIAQQAVKGTKMEEKRTPLEDFLLTLRAEERPAILSYAKVVAHSSSLEVPGFLDLLKYVSCLDEDARNFVHQNLSVLNGLNLSERVDVMKEILALGREDRKSLMGEINSFVLDGMDGVKRIRLIKSFQMLTPEMRSLVIPQVQQMFGSITDAHVKAVLAIDSSDREDAIMQTKSLISDRTSTDQRALLLQTVASVTSDRKAIVMQTRELGVSERVEETISCINALRKIESCKRQAIIQQIKDLRTFHASVPKLLQHFSSADLIMYVETAMPNASH